MLHAKRIYERASVDHASGKFSKQAKVQWALRWRRMQ